MTELEKIVKSKIRWFHPIKKDFKNFFDELQEIPEEER